MNSKYKYLLFDWDGCLAKTLNIWLESYKQTLTELGIKRTDSEITAVFGDWHGGSKLGAPDNDEFFDRVDELVKEKMPKVELYEGAAKVIKKLDKNGFTLAVLSSSLRDYLEPAMRSNGIFEHFDLIITGEDVKKHKPDPEGVDKAVKELNANKKLTIIIGDSDKDVKTANNAGIDSILFYPEAHELFYSFDSLKKSEPTHVASNFQNIYEYLNN